MTESPGPRDRPLRNAVAAWAEWHVLAGALDAVDDPRARVPVATGPAPPVVSSGTAAAARALAAGCRSIAEIEAALESIEGFALKETATRLCLYDGDPAARLMLVGEAPGIEEDRQGRPFVGVSGKLLDRMLAAIGLDRGGVYLTNLLFWRPPGNRSPSTDEIATCLPFLERQIELVAPTVLVSVGGVAAKTLLGLTETVTRMRGRRFTYEPPNGPPIPTYVLLHPAFLLRQPLHKRHAWRDLLTIRAELVAHGVLLPRPAIAPAPGGAGGGAGSA